MPRRYSFRFTPREPAPQEMAANLRRRGGPRSNALRLQWICGSSGGNVSAHCRECRFPAARASAQGHGATPQGLYGIPVGWGGAKDAHGEGPSGAVQHGWGRPRCRMAPLHAGSGRVGDTTCCYPFRPLALPKPRVVGSSPTGGASLFADFASSSSAGAPRGAGAQSRRALARLFRKSSEPKPAPSNVQVAGSGMRKSPGPAPM